MNLINRFFFFRKLLLSILFLMLFLLSSRTHIYAAGSDSLTINLQQADEIFLQHNFSLLAEKFQVNADQALIRQARLWDNPSFSTELGMNSTNHPKLLYTGKNGQVAYNIDQVIQIAGQRNKKVKIAQLQAMYSQAGFDALVSSLKLTLHSTFFDLYFKQRTLSVLTDQEGKLTKIMVAYRRADSSGSVAHADLIRLQALQLTLKNERLSLIRAVFNTQQTLQQLLSTTTPLRPKLTSADLTKYTISKYKLPALIDSAFHHRPDLKMTQLDLERANTNLSLQRSLAVPDLHVGLTYDRQGGYLRNYWGVTLGIDLPFWNRNQGNIKSAAWSVMKSNALHGEFRNKLVTDVQSAYEQVVSFEHGFQNSTLNSFQDSFKQLIADVAGSFSKGNISLLQFIDYFNSYSDNIQDLNTYYASLYEAYERLNYAVGIELFR